MPDIWCADPLAARKVDPRRMTNPYITATFPPQLRTALAGEAKPGGDAPALTAVPIERQADHVFMWDEATGCEIRLMTVSPELAAHWLMTYNSCNRPQRLRLIGAYAHDMKSSQWQFTGDPVRFGTDGLLYDGQHRLHAIAESGVPQRILVIRGLHPEARGAIDGGALRRISDDLKMDGVASTQLNTLTAIATRAIYWEMGVRLPHSGNPRNLTKMERLSYIRSHPELEHVTRRGVQVAKATRRDLRPAVAGFTFWLCLDVSEQDAYTFFEDLELVSQWKKELSPNSPVKALRRRLQDPGLTEADQLYLVLKAWIYFRSDRPADRLSLPKMRAQGEPMTADKIPDPRLIVPSRTASGGLMRGSVGQLGFDVDEDPGAGEDSDDPGEL